MKSTDLVFEWISINGPGLDNVTLSFEEVIIQGANGQEVIAYRVVGYEEDGIFYHDNIPQEYLANCHGYSTGIDLWILDLHQTASEAEDSGFRSFMEGILQTTYPKPL